VPAWRQQRTEGSLNRRNNNNNSMFSGALVLYCGWFMNIHTASASSHSADCIWQLRRRRCYRGARHSNQGHRLKRVLATRTISLINRLIVQHSTHRVLLPSCHAPPSQQPAPQGPAGQHGTHPVGSNKPEKIQSAAAHDPRGWGWGVGQMPHYNTIQHNTMQYTTIHPQN
jgi:hypothetical protein